MQREQVLQGIEENLERMLDRVRHRQTREAALPEDGLINGQLSRTLSAVLDLTQIFSASRMGGFGNSPMRQAQTLDNFSKIMPQLAQLVQTIDLSLERPRTLSPLFMRIAVKERAELLGVMMTAKDLITAHAQESIKTIEEHRRAEEVQARNALACLMMPYQMAWHFMTNCIPAQSLWIAGWSGWLDQQSAPSAPSRSALKLVVNNP